MPPIDTVVIGAGPYGLSIAAHLRAAGKSFRIIGQPMDSWRNHMPKGMKLKSECFASSLWDPQRQLTYERFCADTGRIYQATGRPVPLDEFIDYARWFEARAVPDVIDTRLEGLERSAGGFKLSLSNGEIWTAARVVLATGHASYLRVPEIFARLQSDRVVHTHHVNDPSRFRGQDVIVIGGGQGSLETAALVLEAGASRVRVLVRDAAVDFNRPPRRRSWLEMLVKPEAGLSAGWRSLFYSELPWLFRRLPASLRAETLRRTFGPAGSWWLRDRVVGKVELLTDHQVVGAEADASGLTIEVKTAQGAETIRTDAVISGTGFQPGLERLKFLSPELRSAIRTENGYPVLDRSFQSSVRGLHFVGLASSQAFGPVMRFMYGAKHAAVALAQIA